MGSVGRWKSRTWQPRRGCQLSSKLQFNFSFNFKPRFHFGFNSNLSNLSQARPISLLGLSLFLPLSDSACQPGAACASPERALVRPVCAQRAALAHTRPYRPHLPWLPGRHAASPLCQSPLPLFPGPFSPGRVPLPKRHDASTPSPVQLSHAHPTQVVTVRIVRAPCRLICSPVPLTPAPVPPSDAHDHVVQRPQRLSPSTPFPLVATREPPTSSPCLPTSPPRPR